jgi:hypothetical protein
MYKILILVYFGWEWLSKMSQEPWKLCLLTISKKYKKNLQMYNSIQFLLYFSATKIKAIFWPIQNFKCIVMTFLVQECYGSPKKSIKFVKIRQNSSNFVKIRVEECYDKVLNEEF